MIAHELRTPLTTLVLGSRILLGRTGPGRPQEGIALDLAAETLRLADAVEDLLVLAAIDDAPAAPEPVSLGHVVRDALHQAAATEPEIHFGASVAADVPPVMADDGDVRHVVRSLVANAVAGAREGGTVDADLRRLPGDRVRLRLTGAAVHRLPAPSGDPRPGTLREAALWVLSARLGAALTLATGPRRAVGQVILASGQPGGA